MAVQLNEMTGAQTYAQLSGKSLADPTDTKLAVPGRKEEPVSAAALQAATLAAVSDLFGIVVPTASAIPS